MTWSEIRNHLTEFNKKNNITKKEQNGKPICKAVAVITEDSFSKKYNLAERSYKFTNYNKAFLPDMIGTSIFADSLDGSDKGVRLDEYIYDRKWKVEYCYIEE